MEVAAAAAAVTLLAAFTISSLLLRSKKNKKKKLPPGPRSIPILGIALLLLRRRRSGGNNTYSLQDLRQRYGPIVTTHVGSVPSIFVFDRHLAHKLLVENGSTFSDRLKPLIGTSHIITRSSYGPIWRLLRRNLNSEILQPNRVKLYGPGRDWVLDVLDADLRRHAAEAGSGAAFAVVESFQFAMFCLLALMCFGEKLDENAIRDIEAAQRNFLLYISSKMGVFAVLPTLAKYLFRNRYQKALELRRRQKELYQPLFRARREHKAAAAAADYEQQQSTAGSDRYVYSYLDSLLDIELPVDGGRRLTDDEIVALCSEFLNAGTDTTATALQWIMANLVKHQDVQAKLAEEIIGSSEEDRRHCSGTIKEEDLHRMKYLKAVVMEGLRRHPPGHLVLPHAVSEEVDVDVDGKRYVIPKDASINFAVADISRDERNWAAPMEFRPERFMAGGDGEGVDMTGSREVRMMPFGVGRRMCPGMGLAMLHLEYFVANLVRRFQWLPAQETEDQVDLLSERVEFTVVMKKPLMARLVPRSTS